MGNLVRGKTIATEVFVFLDKTSYFRYYIFSDRHCSFFKTNKKKYFTCYVLLRQQIVSTTKISATNEATTDLEKLQVCSSENELADFYRNLERRNISRSSSKSFRNYILFSKSIMYDNLWEWARIYKAELWDDKATPLKQLTSFSPLPKCYVCRGTGWG